MSDVPLHQHALLSDCGAAALVTAGGSVDWLCLSRFDSPSVFARLLEQDRHRLSRAGNRRMNHMIHIAAVTQIRLDTDGRDYYRRKRSEGKKPLEAMRCLKRRISDAIYRQLLTDAQLAAGHESDAGPGGHCGATKESSAVDLPPHIDASDQPLPGPAAKTLRPPTPTRKTSPPSGLKATG
jgi:hypothetical protein